METLFDEIKPQLRSRQIVDQFRRAIAEGALCIGDRLPPERELCLQLGVSRTSLREAVRILEAYGMVRSSQGDGTYITDTFGENVFEFLGFGDMLNRDNFRHLLHTRRVIETGAAEQAVEAADGKDVERLAALVDELEAEKDPRKLGMLDARFHELIIEMSGNPILAALYRMIHKILLRGTSLVITLPTARDVAVRDHREIAESFRKRSKKECAASVRRHLKNTEVLIEKYLNEEG